MDNGFLTSFLNGAPPGVAAPPPAPPPAHSHHHHPHSMLAASANAGMVSPGGGGGHHSGMGATMAHHLSSLAAAVAANPWGAHGGFPGFPPAPQPGSRGGGLIYGSGGGVQPPPPSQPFPPMFSPSPPSAAAAAASNAGVLHRFAAENSRAAVAMESHRMAEVQRALENGRKESSSASSGGSSNMYLPPGREPLFSHGFSPLDRGGLYPSHGGILDPLSMSAALHKVSSDGPGNFGSAMLDYPGASSSPFYHPPPQFPYGSQQQQQQQQQLKKPKSESLSSSMFSLAKDPDNGSSMCNAGLEPFSGRISRESPEEEVLVDDFDGECCRTYPYNHSKIQKWQKAKKAAMAAKMHTSASANNRDSEKRKEKGERKESKSEQSAANNIPVGIAIGRQRLQDSSGNSSNSSNNQSSEKPQQQQPQQQQRPEERHHHSHGHPRVPLPRPSADKFDHESPAGVVVAQQPHPTPPPQPQVPPPHHWPLWSPSSSPFPNWMPPAGGPIPMGYQLAKDPLTGQILLIPTEGMQQSAAAAAAPRLWPPPAAHHFDPREAAAAAHYHQMIMQQQHLQYLQAAAISRESMHSASPFPGAASLMSPFSSHMLRRNLEPETITVSDDDEVPVNAALGKQQQQEQQLQQHQQQQQQQQPEVKVEKYLTAEAVVVPKSEDIRKEEPVVAAAEPPPPPEATLAVASTQQQTHTEQPALPVKSEPPEDVVFPHSDNNKIEDCINALLALSNQAEETPQLVHEEDSCGLDVLLRGIELHKQQQEEVEDITPITSFSLLCSVTLADTISLGVYTKYLNYSSLSVNLLCAATEMDYHHHLTWVDPLVLLKRNCNLHQYRDSQSELASREFVAARIRKYGKDSDSESADNYLGIRSLGRIIKQIKNTDIMSQLEVDLRAKLVQLQATYRERQRDLSRLIKTTPKKKGGSISRLQRRRGPGRPKKRKLKSSKAKMGRPRKENQQQQQQQPGRVTENEDNDEEEEEEEEELPPPVLEPCTQASFASLASSSMMHSNTTSTSSSISQQQQQQQQQQLLKPPKLTASLSHNSFSTKSSNNSVTSLSTISAKFMKGKASPFANLMKLATVPSAPAVAVTTTSETAPTIHRSNLSSSRSNHLIKSSNLEDVTEEEEEELRESEQSGFSLVNSPPSLLTAPSAMPLSPPPPVITATAATATTTTPTPPPPSSPRPKFSQQQLQKRCHEAEDASSASSKKRKSEKPRKHTGSTETIVPKTNKRNLFMMNCLSLQQQRGFGGSNNKEVGGDEYDFPDDEDEEASAAARSFAEYQVAAAAAAATASTSAATATTSSPMPSSNFVENKEGDKQQSLGLVAVTTQQEKPPQQQQQQSPSKSRKDKGKSGHGRANSHEIPNATLTVAGLTNEQRILVLQEGRFWPARLLTTQLDGVFNVVIEKTRNNKPIIMARDDIIRDSVLEIKPKNRQQLPIGTRVCVYWSQLYNCLFPGTVEHIEVPVRDNMVQVVLDDGDRRQVDITNVRLLPPDYSRVVYDPDPIASLRKRRVSSDSVDSGSGERHLLQQRPPPMAPLTSYVASSSQLMMISPTPSQQSPPPPPKTKKSKSLRKHKRKHKHHHCKHRHKKHKNGNNSTSRVDPETGTLRIKLDGSFNNTTTYSIRSPMYQARSEESNMEEEEDMEDEEEEDSSEEEEDMSSGEEEEEEEGGKVKVKTVGGVNPVTGKPLWTWLSGDEGYRRPGSKGKAAKKLFHRAVRREGETEDEVLNVGDCAVFLSAARVDRPYIGRVELLWETWNGHMMVKVKWFYHPEEIETAAKSFDLKIPGGLFQSPHTDENDVQTISHKCHVLPLKEYSRALISDPVKRKKIFTSTDHYYLAGSYDPTVMSVTFQTGVLKQ